MSMDVLQKALDAQLQLIEEHIAAGNDRGTFMLAELFGVLNETMQRLSTLDLGDDDMSQDFTDMAETFEQYQEELESDEGEEGEEEDDSSQGN